MNFFALALVLASASISSSHATNWANPPVACIENQVPRLLPCLDLTSVANPFADLPAGMTEAEIRFWTIENKPDLLYCRAKEVQRREAARPGSQSPGSLETAWMLVEMGKDIPEKIRAIYDAAERADMPPQILFGALKQESLLSNLGITVDGANFSCGIGQVNVLEWCEYMRTLPSAEQRRMNWPVGLSCDTATLTTELVRPFYNIALRRLGGRPDYYLTPREFEGITQREVVGQFPAGDASLQAKRFRATTNFVKYCSDLHHGIAAKGRELRRLFDVAVPAPLKEIEVYRGGASFPLACERPYRSRYYPLHTGWLLADAIYNAGDRQVSVLQYYYRMTKSGHESGSAWKPMNPLVLIEALHWGGKWNETSQKIEYQNVYGVANSQTWFKTCVVQRHIASVIQYAAQPGQTIAKSLEQVACSRTTVPAYRKKSPGRIPAKKPPRPQT